MPLFDMLLLIAAGFAAGGMNALAGGGTFFSFPALLATGLPPVTANATNAVALWPASLAGAWAARSALRPLGRYLLPLLLAGLLGGLFAASPWLSRWLAARRKDDSAIPPHAPASLAAHGLVSIYGGYFGAGMGILQLAAFSIEGHQLVRANALKNLISAVIYSVATATFIIAGRVSLYELAILLIGTTLGGYAGGALSKKLPASWLRVFVIVVGASMTLYYFQAIYWR